MPRSLVSAVVVPFSLLFPLPASAAIRSIEPDAARGTAKAVVVDGEPLIHTGQILPQVVKGDAAAQFAAVVDRLKTVLARSGSSLDGVVKLNVYVAGDDHAAFVRKRLPAVFTGAHKPAVCFVVTPLPNASALVAVDAVAVLRKKERLKPGVGLTTVDGVAVATVDPSAGRLIFISGQAERGKDLTDATRKTMAGLHRTLKFLGAKPEHVVQVKSFLSPMKSVAGVEREIAESFPKGKVPPTSHVEWTAGGIEIEMIVFVPYQPGETAGKSRLRFVTPPWMKSSPVFSRVAIVEGGTVIYVSGLTGRRDGTGAEQVGDVFTELQRIAKLAGSDLRHLAKATYYVADDAVSRQLNVLRPKYYDPRRPPAASKAGVKGVGLPGRTLVIDMIAVPTGRPEK